MHGEYSILVMKCMCFFHLCRLGLDMWHNVPFGFKPSKEHSMTVAFYAIVPLDIWEWDDNSGIYIRFGHSLLGDWEFYAGPGERIRYSSCECVLYHIYVLRNLQIYAISKLRCSNKKLRNCKPISKLRSQVCTISKICSQVYAISKLLCAN